MNKKHRILIEIALVSLLFTCIALATTLSTSSDVIIYAFDQNPAGSDKGNEWVTFYNPSNESVDIGNWTLETADGERETIPEGTTLYPGAYYVYTPPYQWLDSENESITLRDSKGEEV
ncbi:MAG: lamin tail domain-containing protein, partial [Methanophagales archaeon]|nr:lamin tail domain-containing protein [Methanophagales archaeon]